MASPVPTEITKTGPAELTVRWDDGHTSVFRTRFLRTECMCAHCVSEMTGERILDPNSVAEDVTIAGAEHVGRYGVKFYFSDGHGDGIYTWSRLRQICQCEECRSGLSVP
ncbi:MAG: gamma-butyrobetaine hydroxylase-like domain-containing protein [Blastocatellia bacterium]